MTGQLSDTEYARRKYYGDVARDYEARRAGEPKYEAEARMLPEWLADLPARTSLLDCPVGTGRFIPFYESKGFTVLGMDVSKDMIAEAVKKRTSPLVSFDVGDLVKLEDAIGSSGYFSVAVCLRILNRLTPYDFRQAMRGLQWVARDRVIFNLRVRDHKRAKPYELIKDTLLPGWSIARDEAEVEHDPNYRMIELRQ